MPRNERLEVRAGISGWLKAAHVLMTGLGMLSALTSPANWTWKLTGIALLSAASVFLYAKMVRAQRPGVLILHADGTARINDSGSRAFDAVLQEQGWVSRYLCVVRLRVMGDGKKCCRLVCRSENRRDDYRRLLALLRMRPASTDSHRVIWS